jgi:transcriptional regulator with XRE-family HTH domain
LRVAQLRNPDAMKIIGENVKKYRLERDLTQESLANLSGIDWSTISRLERGVVNTSISVVFALADALKIKPSQLLE